MTTPRSQLPGRSSAEPPALVQIPAVLRTAGGSPSAAPVVITTRAAAPRVMLVTAMGVDAAWLPMPQRSGIVPAGTSVQVTLPVTPSMGTLPARYPFVVTVQALDPGDGRVMSSASIAESVLLVDAPGSIELTIEPMDAA